jgi:uncharacterized protein with von Willebrand factor type A (vWA) domain
VPARHARYSAWTGQPLGDAPDALQVLDALSDAVLTDGVDAAMSGMMHKGFENDEHGALPGLDDLRNQLRSAQREAVQELVEHLNSDELADAAMSTADDDIRRMLNALRAHSPVLPGLFSGATAEQRINLEDVLQASAPGLQERELSGLIDRIIDLARLESQVRSVRVVDDLGHVDLELLEKLLGEVSSDGFGRLVTSMQEFGQSGFITRKNGQAALSARAVQHIGDALLLATINRLRSRTHGEHARHGAANHHEPSGTSRDYQFGDPFELDLGRSLLEAVKRKPGAPVVFDPDDLKIVEREAGERATTILAIDLSRSMGERGYLLAAKKLALALSTYIRRRFPHDELLLIGFSESARPILLQELVDLQWDRYGFGTNVHDALRVANNILAAHRGRKRNLVVITDGEPTAHRDRSGAVQFNHPPTEETLALTYREASRLRRDDIYLYICMLSDTDKVSEFGRELARHAAGQVMLTDPGNLTAELIEGYGSKRR